MTTPVIKTFQKAAVERKRMYLDYSCWLEQIEKLTDTQITVNPYTADGPMTVSSGYTDTTSKKLVVFIAGGIANTNYTMSVVIRTDAGQIKKDNIGVRVTS